MQNLLLLLQPCSVLTQPQVPYWQNLIMRFITTCKSQNLVPANISGYTVQVNVSRQNFQ